MDTKYFSVTDPTRQPEAVEEAAALLRAGEVVAIPTETVYGLAANAFSEEAVKKIFVAKGRPQDNPLIVHIAELETLDLLAAEVPPGARTLAERCWPGPLTIILPKRPCVPDAVTAGLPTVAVRMPSHPTARAVIRAAGVPLAAPSANLSGFPSPTCFEDVKDDMDGRVAAIVDGGACGFGIESTVVSLATDPPRLLRPGAVTPETLREALGALEIDPAVLNPLGEGETAASPGMKYKHYAPKAAVFVVKGPLAELLCVAKRRPEFDHALCFEEETAFLRLPAVTYGSRTDPFTQTRGLFTALRELDRAGAVRALAHAPAPEGVGLGVCNRLYRAAGFRFAEPETKGRIYGVCGLSGAGKSTLCEAFRARGAEVISADAVAREIVEPGSPVLIDLQAAFGPDVVRPDGSLDRRRLGARAFSSPALAEKLSAITHPEIVRRCEARARAASAAGNTAVIDAPLLFSSGLDRLCDLTLAVAAPVGDRMARIAARDGLPPEEIEKRFASQKNEEQLLPRADVTLQNDAAHDLAAQFRLLFLNV